MATKTSRPCTSDHPETCRYHGAQNKINQISTLQDKIASIFTTPAIIAEQPTASTIINRAVNSPLDYKGEKPKWWNSYSQESENHKLAPSKAVLVDIINNPDGPIAVVWQYESQRSNDLGSSLGSGYGTRICYFKDVETGEDLGHLTTTFMDDTTLERSFGDDELTPFRYQDRYSGTSYGFNYDEYIYGDRDLTGEALLQKKREIWVVEAKKTRMGITDSNGEYVASYNINISHAPDDKTVAKDLKVHAKRIKKEMTSMRDFYAVPYVDYSSVEEPLKGKGYGTAMYVYTSRMLAQENRVLRASGLQTDYAQNVWARFKEKFPKNIDSIELVYRGEKRSERILDFRKKA